MIDKIQRFLSVVTYRKVNFSARIEMERTYILSVVKQNNVPQKALMPDQATRGTKNGIEMNGGNTVEVIVYLQTLQVRLRQGTLVVSCFTARFEIASRLVA